MLGKIQQWWGRLIRSEETAAVAPDLGVQSRASVDERWECLQEEAWKLIRAGYRTIPPDHREAHRRRLEAKVRAHLTWVTTERVDTHVNSALHQHNLDWGKLDEAMRQKGPPPPPPTIWDHLGD